ncbi:hypothetical protein AB0K52_12450 [Glycomyces sp. NPDC049804]|uniref:hypothetical protein n=1 Tax=Glycomyces sp. NPDC049804 TaxID=3154363 RepID=UPI003449C4F8
MYPEDPHSSSPLPPRLERRARPPFVPRPVDPIAAVAANATALGFGYLLMRRRRLAATAITGTAFLLFALAAEPDSLPWRLLFGLWWLLVCLHAWYLTRGTDPALLGDRRRARLLAIGAAGLALLVLAGFRTDAWLAVRSAEDAHAAGDCEAAVETLDRLGPWHRIAFGAKVLEGEEQSAACRLLNEARAEGAELGADTMLTYMDHPEARWDGAGVERAGMLFDAARGGGAATYSELESGFQQLIDTLEDSPGQTDRVRETVEQFMADLDQDTDACDALAIDDWIGEQIWEAPALTEPIAAAAEAVPLRLLACARYRSADDLTGSQAVYQRFLTEYPDHAEHQAAVDELYAVDSRIEYARVTALLEADEYCGPPAPWRDAPAHEGGSPHPMWVIGLSPGQYDFPAEWTSDTVDATQLVVCVEGPEKGEHLESCFYESDAAVGGYREVDFYATRIKVEVYELRTGERIDSYTVQFDGDPCPEVLEYSYYYADLGPPGSVEAEVSDGQVRSAFERLQD